MNDGRLNSSDNLDYDYQCSSNLGPCNYTYCNEACCYRECNNYYSGFHPHPICEDQGPRWHGRYQLGSNTNGEYYEWWR
ncbi:hypothetical protein H5410_034951 [Solanum commersonii]|uniref:Uncharacterized protein n=1 Tax=Solanum commersonii TaxID=4109 RepID=A0A9J5Y1I8_SOLCO|nr:hypothetical protein H5410_034951 [Solanum commersonii]